MSADHRVRHWASPRVDVFLGVLGGIAACSVFFLVLLPGTARTVHHVAAAKKPLTVAEIMARLGEYDQRIPDCAGLVSGLTGYAYARPKVTGGLEVVLVCK